MVINSRKNRKGSVKGYFKRIVKNWDMYLLLLPALVFLVLFKYAPMWGVRIAFVDYNIFQGMAGSEFVGLKHFEKLVASAEFFSVLKNTLVISFLKIGILFPMGVVIALILNEIHCMPFMKTVQTIIYIPHFFSWIVVAGLFTTILSPSGGMVNKMITAFGGESISFMTSTSWFRAVLVFSAGWKEVGWNAIVFIAAIAGVDQGMYEAALIDGAGRLRRIWSITLPAIMPTIILMFIMRIGNLLEAGTEQILAMYNPVVYEVADVIGTYVYRMGLGKMDYSFSTAVGLFNSVVGFILVMLGNTLSRKAMGSSIW